MSFIWHNNNQMQLSHNDQLNLIKKLQVTLTKQTTPSDNVKSNHNGINDTNNDNIKTNNSTNTPTNTSLNNNGTSDDTVSHTREEQNGNINKSMHDINTNVNEYIVKSKEISELMEKIDSENDEIQDQIYKCEKLVNIAMDMINLLVSILEVMINNSIDSGISYFEQLQTETSTIAYMLYYVVSFRLQQIGKIQNESDNNNKTFQTAIDKKDIELRELKVNMKNIAKDNTASRIQIEKLKKLVKNKQDAINKLELEQLTQQFHQHKNATPTEPNHSNNMSLGSHSNHNTNNVGNNNINKQNGFNDRVTTIGNEDGLLDHEDFKTDNKSHKYYNRMSNNNDNSNPTNNQHHNQYSYNNNNRNINDNCNGKKLDNYFQDRNDRLSPISNGNHNNLNMSTSFTFSDNRGEVRQRLNPNMNDHGHNNINYNQNNSNSNNTGTSNSSKSLPITKICIPPMSSQFSKQLIHEYEINPIPMTMLSDYHASEPNRLSTSETINYFDSNGILIPGKSYEKRYQLDENRLEFLVGKWHEGQIIENFHSPHGRGDVLREQLFYDHDISDNKSPPRPLISIDRNMKYIIKVSTYKETKQEYENRMIIGIPDMVLLLKYDPFGRNIVLPKFVSCMSQTQDQINTFPIKLCDSKFCGNPNNYNDISHYHRLEQFLQYVPNFYYYFVTYEFKIEDFSLSTQSTQTDMRRELYFYPRKGRATEGAYVLYGTIKFFPNMDKLFDINSVHFEFLDNFSDKVYIEAPSNQRQKLFCCPRAFSIYHNKFSMHLEGDHKPEPQNSRNKSYNNRMYISFNIIGKAKYMDRNEKQKLNDRQRINSNNANQLNYGNNDNQRAPASIPYTRNNNNRDSFLTGPSSRQNVNNNMAISSHNQFRTSANSNDIDSYHNRHNINQRQFGSNNNEFVRSRSVNANMNEMRNPNYMNDGYNRRINSMNNNGIGQNSNNRNDNWGNSRSQNDFLSRDVRNGSR